MGGAPITPMATKLAMTASVKTIDVQRWVCRSVWVQFKGSSWACRPKRGERPCLYDVALKAQPKGF